MNELMLPAAKKAAQSPECYRVDLVELSGNRSVPGKKIVFFVDCKNTLLHRRGRPEGQYVHRIQAVEDR